MSRSASHPHARVQLSEPECAKLCQLCQCAALNTCSTFDVLGPRCA
jgi:hypothetical protein